MIPWKDLAFDSPPTNVNKVYPGSPETPFVSCIVWVCAPGKIRGGVADVIRWDTKNKCWYKPDMIGKWLFEPPYIISHFCDDINLPSE